MKIFPSLISGDLMFLDRSLKELDDHCDGYHIDVMDDHFVPNLTWGPAFVDAIRKGTRLPLHLHLMVTDPKKWVGRTSLAKDDLFIFHYEAISDSSGIFTLVNDVKESGCKVGIAINPATPIECVMPYFDSLDHVLLMSVNPGFSGQSFMPEVLEKVAPLVAFRSERTLNFTIGMDGGVGSRNIKDVASRGVDEVGAASAIFYQPDRVQAIRELYRLAG